MRNYKFIFFVLIFISNSYLNYCQNSLETIVPSLTEQFDEYKKQITPSSFEYKERKIEQNFKNKYEGKKFNYTEKVKEKKTRNWNFPTINLSASFFKFMLYFLITIGILIIVYQVLKNNSSFSFNGKKNKVKVKLTDEFPLENPENIEELNFEFLVNQAKKDNDYRKAIRFYYLWILQRLTEKNLIKWNKNKTNYEYLIELKQNPIQSDFSNNSYIYDYIWYGNFELNDEEFKKAEYYFQNTINQLK